MLSQPVSGYQEWIKAQIVADNLPDIESNYGPNLIEQYKGNYIVDISKDLSSPNKYNGNEIWKDTFIDGKLELAHEYKYKDKFAIPLFGTGLAVYYNKTMYDELGLKVPETWEEFMSNCSKIEKSKKTPIAFMSQKEAAVIWMSWELTGGLLAQKLLGDPNINYNGDCNISDEEVIKSIKTGYMDFANNKYLMTDVLKNEWKFKGFVVSDWESVIQLMNQGVAENETECAALAFSAGPDTDMASSCYLKYIKNLISDGIIDEEQLDEAVMRILRVKYEMGLFDNPYSVKSGADISKEAEMSLRLAEESMVLLKNTDKTLPLKKGVKVAVIGDFVCEERSHAGNWALDIDTALINSVRDIFEKSDVDFIYPESMLPEDMIGCAAMADTAVVVIGESYLVTGETHSIANIEIPQYTTEFVKSVFKVQKNLVGIFCYARPRAIENIEIYFKSILYAWHAGTNAAEAVMRRIRYA